VHEHSPSGSDGPAPAPGRLRAALLPRGRGTGYDGVEAAPAVHARALIRAFWPFARPYRRQIAVGLAFLLLVPAVQAAEIWMFKLAFDEVVLPADLSALTWLAPLVIGLALMGAVFAFGEDYTWTWAGERFLLDLRLRFFSHVQSLTPDALSKRRPGDVLSRLNGDVQAIESFVLGGLAELVSSSARIVFFAGALFLLDWRLALVVLVVGPLFAVSARWFATLAKEAAREKRRRSGSLTAVAEESLANAALVRSCGRAGDERERVRREGEGIVQAELAAVRVNGAFGPVSGLIELAGVLTVIALGTWSVQEGQLTVGGLVAFLAYLSQLLRPMNDLGNLATSLFAAAAGGERVMEVLEERPTVTERAGARELVRARGAFSLEDVSYRHAGAAEPVLEGVNLAVGPGEVVALSGPSGGGKSTLVRLLARFADPAAGRVLLDGHDLRVLTLASVRGNVGYLQQETLLFDRTVGENIAFGAPDATQAEIEQAARSARAHDFVTGLPDGYGTRVGPRGANLSGGQRRRIEVARTLLRDTPVVVLDEPTTGLDGPEAACVAESLRALLDGRTAIVATHDPHLLAVADRVLRVEGGAVAEQAAVPA